MQHRHNKKSERIFYWTPRVLAILIILFLAIFAFDVFTPDRSIPEMIGAFLIHLMPNYLLIAALVLAWKKELYGGILFLIIGIFFTLFFHTYQNFLSLLIISFPVFAIGILFIVHKKVFLDL